MTKLSKLKEIKIFAKLKGMQIIDKACYLYYESGMFSLA